MEYERVILELLERIGQLEERVERLENRTEEPTAEGEVNLLQKKVPHPEILFGAERQANGGAVIP